VGTVTEIYDYLRLLFARVGVPHCPQCGKVIERQTVDQIVDRVGTLAEGTRLQVLAPVVRARKGEHTKLLEDARRNGYVRARIDGEVYDLGETPKLDKNKNHTIEIVVDRIIARPGIQQRLSESIEAAMVLSGGLVIFAVAEGEGNTDLIFSANFACVDCGISLTEIEPRAFSFNNPAGACSECSGLGMKMIFDPELLVPNPALSLAQGAIAAPGWNAVKAENSSSRSIFAALSEAYKFDLNIPYGDLPAEIKKIIMEGTDREFHISYTGQDGKPRSYPYTHEGLANNLWRRYKETSSSWMRMEYEALMTQIKCPSCTGRRLKPEVLAVTVGGANIAEVTAKTIGDVQAFFKALKLNDTQHISRRRS
jgi:excinuclease ABC subunit A